MGRAGLAPADGDGLCERGGEILNGDLRLHDDFFNHLQLDLEPMAGLWESGPSWGTGTTAPEAAAWGEQIASLVEIRAGLPDGTSRMFWSGDAPGPGGGEQWNPAEFE